MIFLSQQSLLRKKKKSPASERAAKPSEFLDRTRTFSTRARKQLLASLVTASWLQCYLSMSEGPSGNSTTSTQSHSVDDGEKCVICNSPNAEDMLICDKCDKGYHKRFIGLDHVPEEDPWFCDPCIDGTEVRSKPSTVASSA